ncbi:hypothetical protein ACFE04_018647 [Oxalis oulophora]
MDQRDLTSKKCIPFPESVMSPSCFPVQEKIEYTRIQYINCGNNNKRVRKWRNLLKKMVRDGKNKYGSSKQLSFHYDAVSYSQNFDEGCHRYEDSQYCPQVF